MPQRLREAVRTTHRLVGVPILQQFDDDVVELNEPHIEPLLTAAEIGDSQGLGAHAQLVREDFLIGEQRVLNTVALEIAVEAQMK